MPVINEDYVQDSIKSICNQSYTNWELFILACGPLKSIDEIVDKFNDPRIQIIKLESSIGMLKIFTAGLLKTNGEYIIRHDPDDLSLPKRLELQVSYLNKNSQIGMVSCGIKAFTTDHKYKNLCENINRVQSFYKTKEDIDQAILGGNYPIIFPTLMIRKALLKDIDIQYKKTDFEDEIELVLSLLSKSSIGKIVNILYYYRRHSNAYHHINYIERIKHVKTILDNGELMNSIRYREFHNELINTSVEKLNINQSSILRVLMIIDELNIGGTETYVFNITKALIKMGVYVLVASAGGISEELFKQHGIKTIRISINIKLMAIEEIKHLIDNEGINLLHCHLNKSMELGKEIYKKYNISYIITLHGMFYSKEILLSTCMNAKAIIAVSNPVKNLFIENIGTKFQGILRVLPNGIDTETFKPNPYHRDIRQELGIPKNGLIILYCSRLGWGKGAIAEQVLSSFKEISLKSRNIYCIIVGEGDKKDTLIMKSKELNLSLNRKSIYVIGARYDILSYYLDSDLVIGTGRVALEAISCEKPVIATGIMGCIGIVCQQNKDEMWNLYFGDHQGKEDINTKLLTKSLQYLIDLPQKRLELGKWGRDWCIEKFQEIKVANKILELYADIFKGEKET